MSDVYVVHCVDTEGPLHESLEATFERLRHIFHLDLEPSRDLLRKLQEGRHPLKGLEKAVQKVVAPDLLDYNDTWDKIDAMLRDALSPAFRNRSLDADGGGWVYNWFCVDHVDYDVNPRRRDMGYHNIFDHYRAVLRELGASRDGLHFHYHPHAFVRAANLCATHWWTASDSLHQVLSRRILDRGWFPSANRPGFQVNRPDSHWFLEQYIPFDLASLAMEAVAEDQTQFDFSYGRSGDWRRAPDSWAPYHPSHDDWQVPGACRRWIGRCLNVGSRAYLLSEKEVRQAFAEAREGKPVILSFAGHDFRDIRKDVEHVRALLAKVAPAFPGVRVRFAEALDAFRKSLALPSVPPCELDLELKSVDGSHALTVRTETPPFGPQPFLALKTATGDYLHDNLDWQKPGREWTYVFDGETYPLRAIEKIGVAANNAIGTATVTTLDAATGKTERRVWNAPA